MEPSPLSAAAAAAFAAACALTEHEAKRYVSPFLMDPTAHTAIGDRLLDACFAAEDAAEALGLEARVCIHDPERAVREAEARNPSPPTQPACKPLAPRRRGVAGAPLAAPVGA
jgi:hypothetical protein